MIGPTPRLRFRQPLNRLWAACLETPSRSEISAQEAPAARGVRDAGLSEVVHEVLEDRHIPDELERLEAGARFLQPGMELSAQEALALRSVVRRHAVNLTLTTRVLSTLR